MKKKNIFLASLALLGGFSSVNAKETAPHSFNEVISRKLDRKSEYKNDEKWIFSKQGLDYIRRNVDKFEHPRDVSDAFPSLFVPKSNKPCVTSYDKLINYGTPTLVTLGLALAGGVVYAGARGESIPDSVRDFSAIMGTFDVPKTLNLLKLCIYIFSGIKEEKLLEIKNIPKIKGGLTAQLNGETEIVGNGAFSKSTFPNLIVTMINSLGGRYSGVSGVSQLFYGTVEEAMKNAKVNGQTLDTYDKNNLVWKKLWNNMSGLAKDNILNLFNNSYTEKYKTHVVEFLEKITDKTQPYNPTITSNRTIDTNGWKVPELILEV